jgi:hypothetical protein
VRETVKERNSWKRLVREAPFREDLSAEAEESPLLEVITRERLVKTQQAGEGLRSAVLICKIWRLAMALNYLQFRVTVCKGLINPIYNPNLVIVPTYYATLRFLGLSMTTYDTVQCRNP